MSKAALYGGVSKLRDYYSGQQCANAGVQRRCKPQRKYWSAKNAKDAKSAKLFSYVFALFALFALFASFAFFADK